MRTFLILPMFLLSASTHATGGFECTAGIYKVTGEVASGAPIIKPDSVNYSVDGVDNVATIEVEGAYLSQNILALALGIDGQLNTLTVEAFNNEAGQYEGTIRLRKVKLPVACKLN